MKRRAPLIRLPQSLIVFALMIAFGVAVISGGVTASQALGGIGWRGADWTVFRWACISAALVVALWSSGLIDWIGDEEIERLQAEEYEQSLTARFFRRVSRRTLTVLTFAAILVDFFWQDGFHRYFDSDVPLPDGGYGSAIYGMTFGSVRLFGRIWSGVDLAFVVPLTVVVLLILRAGFKRITRANHDYPQG